MTLGVGQNSLGKARFFLDRFRVVESAEPFDVFAASAYLEAAIVFGKATIDSVLSHVAPGDAKAQEAWLKSSPLWNPFCKFFADARGFIVHHDKTVDVTPRTTVTVRVPTARAYVT